MLAWYNHPQRGDDMDAQTQIETLRGWLDGALAAIDARSVKDLGTLRGSLFAGAEDGTPLSRWAASELQKTAELAVTLIDRDQAKMYRAAVLVRAQKVLQRLEASPTSELALA